MNDEYSAGPMDDTGPPLPTVHMPFKLPSAVAEPASETKSDPLRPQRVNGRYKLPDAVTGKLVSRQTVTNFVKLCEDTYHLELWKQRNVAKGLAMRPDYVEALQHLDVKADKLKMNKICEAAQGVAGAYKMADEGTALHKSAELAERAGGSLEPVPDHHRKKIGLYLDALRAHGLTVVPEMVERVTTSSRYEVTGTFDNIFRLRDGTYVIGDKKSSDDLELSMHSISGQLACYADGVNESGVWDGTRYDTSIKVSEDFAYVVHIPSTRDEVTVHRIDLGAGRDLLEDCLRVRARRRVKAKHVAEVIPPLAAEFVEAEWLELCNAANTVDELIGVAARARRFGQWTERLAGQARLLAAELTAVAEEEAFADELHDGRMGS